MENWKDINSDFTEELKVEWISKGFNYEEVKEWISIGLGVDDADYAEWLREVKGVGAEWVLNHGNSADLRQEYQQSQKERVKGKSVNAQEWLDKNYPKNERRKFKDLYIESKNLEGSLDLTDFINLERLDCSNNQLTNLNINGLTKLKKLACCDNYLTNLDYSSLDPDKLTYLNITDNNLISQNISIFSDFVNLRHLLIGGVDIKKLIKEVIIALLVL